MPPFLFGPRGRRLDPGRMGTGLLSEARVSQSLDLLEQTAWPPIPEPGSAIYADCFYKPESAEEVRESRDRLIEVYRRAEDERMGILFTDFNDAGVSRL